MTRPQVIHVRHMNACACATFASLRMEHCEQAASSTERPTSPAPARSDAAEVSSETTPANTGVASPIGSAPASSEPVNACTNSGGAVAMGLSTGSPPVSAVSPSADSAELSGNAMRSAVVVNPVATVPSLDGEASKRARSPDSELGQPKLARPASANPPTATTVVQASTTASQIMLVHAGPKVATPVPGQGNADSTVAAPLPASKALVVPSVPVSAEPVSGATAAVLPQRQGGSAPAAPILATSPRQLQPGQGGPLQQAMSPAQAGVPGTVQAGGAPMGMVPGQAWGMWPVMMQAAPGGGMYPMVAQWVPTAAMTAPDGGLPVRVVCRGCGLVRFDVEGRRWVHNHRQGKGNKQFVCNRVLCGCQKGQICPTRGHPHPPIAPGVANAAGMAGQVFGQTPVQPGTSSLPPILKSTGTPPTVFATALAGASSSSSSSSSHSLQPSGGQAVAATLAVAQVPPARIAQVATATVAQVATEMVGDVATATVVAPATATAPAEEALAVAKAPVTPVAVVESMAAARPQLAEPVPSPPPGPQ